MGLVSDALNGATRTKGMSGTHNSSSSSLAEKCEPAPEVTLRDFGEYKNGKITMYTLQLENHRGECWMVAKRYSDLLRCHTRLLDSFARQELPPFPPKEPLFQKVFGRGDARSEWADERKTQLHRYLLDLLQHQGARGTPTVQGFFEAPRSAHPEDGGDWSSEADAVLISGVRARPAGDPGVVEVVVRVKAALPCRVCLALRPLDGEGQEEWREPPITLEGSGPLWCESSLLEVPAGGGEVSHRLSLRPGTTWQVGAVCVVGGSPAGNAAYVRLLAPPDTDSTGAAEGPQEATAAGGLPAEQEHGELEQGVADHVEFMPAASFTTEQELQELAQAMRLGSLAAAEEQDETVRAATSDEQIMPSCTFMEMEVQEMPTATFTHTMEQVQDMPSNTFTESLRSAPAETGPAEAASSRAGAEGEPEAEAEAEPEAEAEAEHEAEAEAFSASGGGSQHSEEDGSLPRPAHDQGGGGVSGTTAAGPTRPGRALFPRRKSAGREVHQVIGFQGVAAAQYIRRVEESQKASMERCPHRFEAAGDGKKTSVNVKFSVVHNDVRIPCSSSSRPGLVQGGPASPDLVAPRTPGGGFAAADMLDKTRRQLQLVQFHEDERTVARWIHAVTGDDGAGAAAEGRCSLREALQSGEALCDLVNAVWPGQVAGVLRGEAQGGRRLLNITRFVQACSKLGVDNQELFAPPDLAEGKNLRSVVRCIFALGALAETCEGFQGPGLYQADEHSESPHEAAAAA